MKKKREDVEALKAVILEAAIQIFSKQGYSGTNLRDIAQAAGVTRTPIYYHFENKYALYLQAADLYLQKKEEAFRAILTSDQDIFTKIRQDLRLCCQMGISEEHLFGEIYENEELHPVYERRKACFERVYEMKLKSIQRAREKGELKKDTDDVRMVERLYVLHFGLMGMAQCRIHDFDVRSLEFQLEEMVKSLQSSFGA